MMSLKDFSISIPVDQKIYELMCSCGLDDAKEWFRVSLHAGAVEFQVVDSAAYRDFVSGIAAGGSLSKGDQND